MSAFSILIWLPSVSGNTPWNSFLGCDNRRMGLKTWNSLFAQVSSCFLSEMQTVLSLRTFIRIPCSILTEQKLWTCSVISSIILHVWLPLFVWSVSLHCVTLVYPSHAMCLSNNPFPAPETQWLFILPLSGQWEYRGLCASPLKSCSSESFLGVNLKSLLPRDYQGGRGEISWQR